MARNEKPFHKMMVTQAKLGMVVEYGERALDGQTWQEFAADVQECMRLLMSFRNIVNSMVSFDQIPEEAVLPYLPDPRKD